MTIVFFGEKLYSLYYCQSLKLSPYSVMSYDYIGFICCGFIIGCIADTALYGLRIFRPSQLFIDIFYVLNSLSLSDFCKRNYIL